MHNASCPAVVVVGGVLAAAATRSGSIRRATAIPEANHTTRLPYGRRMLSKLVPQEHEHRRRARRQTRRRTFMRSSYAGDAGTKPVYFPSSPPVKRSGCHMHASGPLSAGRNGLRHWRHVLKSADATAATVGPRGGRVRPQRVANSAPTVVSARMAGQSRAPDASAAAQHGGTRAPAPAWRRAALARRLGRREGSGAQAAGAAAVTRSMQRCWRRGAAGGAQVGGVAVPRQPPRQRAPVACPLRPFRRAVAAAFVYAEPRRYGRCRAPSRAARARAPDGFLSTR